MREPYVKHLSGRAALGNTDERQGRHITGAVCDRPTQARGGGTGVCEENSEDPAPGNRTSFETSRGDKG